MLGSSDGGREKAGGSSFTANSEERAQNPKTAATASKSQKRHPTITAILRSVDDETGSSRIPGAPARGHWEANPNALSPEVLSIPRLPLAET